MEKKSDASLDQKTINSESEKNPQNLDKSKSNENSGMLTQDQIAALFASQSDNVVSEDQPALTEEQPATVEESILTGPEPELEPKSVSGTSSNAMLTPDQIAALFESQIDNAPSEDELAITEEQSTILDETKETQATSAPASNKIMTPEEIANLIAAQTIDEKPATVEESTLTESEPESVSGTSSNGILSPDQIAALFASQIENAPSEEEPTLAQEQLVVAEETIEAPTASAPAPASNKIMTPEEIANLIAAQTIDETPAVIEETLVAEPKKESDAPLDGMVSQDQIAALFASQIDNGSSEEELAITEEQQAIVDETKETQTTSAPASNKIMTPEEIANLIAAQTIDETPATVEESTLTEPEPESVSGASSNGILSPDQIAALFASQIENAPSEEEPTLAQEQLVAAEETIEAPTASAPAPASNKIMTPEEIANLIAAQTIDETPAVIEETLVAEPKSESDAPLDGMVSQDQIAALFASQIENASSEEELAITEEQPTIVDETKETQTTSAPASNKIMTPEEIANLIAAQTFNETPATVEESTLTEPELENESDSPLDGMVSQDQIAALFASQIDNAPSEEELAITEEQPAFVDETKETQTTSAPASNKIMTPEEIANLIAAQTFEEEPATVEESTLTEPELENESDAPLDGMVSQDQIATLFASQIDNGSSEEELAITEEQSAIAEETNEAPTMKETPTTVDESTLTDPEPKNETELKESLIKKILSLVSQSIISLKKILPKRNRPKKATAKSAPASEEQITEDDTAQTTQDVTAVGIQNIQDNQEDDQAIVDIPTKPTKEKKAKKTKVPKAPKTPKAPKEPKPPKEPKVPTQKSGLKIGLILLGVLILMSGSFIAGNISRDFFILIQPDPTKVAALEAEKAKEAEHKKRAEELAAIAPKDYTSSMYLDSIILKGRAGSMTSIKLKKIDDVSKLDQFTKLRRIKLYDMTGAEDLSVLQNLSSLEEIIIEDSVLQNQFTNGDFKSVISLQMTNCTVNDSAQFANFKKVTELYADTTKFVTEDGNLQITTHMPSLETLTLTGCGEYVELVGVQNLKQLKSLELSGTLVNKTSYVQNPYIKNITVDISFAKNISQVIALSSLKNFESLTIQIGTCPLSPTELSDAVEQITKAHPDASVTLLNY